MTIALAARMTQAASKIRGTDRCPTTAAAISGEIVAPIPCARLVHPSIMGRSASLSTSSIARRVSPRACPGQKT